MKTVTAVASFVVVGALGSSCLLWAFLTVLRGEYLTSLAVAATGLSFFAFLAHFVIVKSGRVYSRATFDSTGTTVRPDRRTELLMLCSTATNVIGFGMFAVLQPIGKLDISVPPQFRYSLPFVAALTALFALRLLFRIIRRGGMGYLHLTPTGFEFVQGPRPQSGQWTQVTDVTNRVPDAEPRTVSAIVITMTDGTHVTLDGATYTPDGSALRKLARSYWKNPGSRAELTNGEALQRLRTER